MFALFGLLVAFTFSGAASRFEDRRHLIAAEANAIGTAYLRLDLLPSDAQPPLRELFLRYLDARFAVYRQIEDVSAVEESARRERAVAVDDLEAGGERRLNGRTRRRKRRSFCYRR